MGAIKKSYEESTDIAHFIIDGSVTVDQILEAAIPFLKEERTPRVLWDVTDGTHAELSNDDIEKIADRGAQAAPRIEGGKGAIVAPKDVDYGLSSMFRVMSGAADFPLEMRVFRETDEAREWLLGN